MAKVAQPTIATDEILFELERFELVDGRLTLAGRWFGVRGRRFVRPTLTPLGGRNLPRVLADLEHKPWAAEDGGPWEAAFAWNQRGVGSKFELSVSPDIVIELPSPNRKLTLPRRFSALPRNASLSPAWPQPQHDQPDELPPSTPAPDVELPPASEDIEKLEARLAAVRAELEAAREELAGAAAARELGASEAAAAIDAASSDAAAAIAARDRLATENAKLMAERDALRNGEAELTAVHGELEHGHSELQTAFEGVSRERDQLAGDLAASQRALDALRSELAQATAAVQGAARERDEAISAHGAALVMRRATRADPYASGHSPWRTALAVLVLLVVVFAILIVAHVL